MNITFNHEAETLPNSININTEELIYTKKALIFSILSRTGLSEMYYDEPDDAPSNMTTTSGRLELGLSLLNKDNMKFYYLYNYKDIYTKLTGMYIAYKNPDILKNLIKEDLDDINILYSLTKTFEEDEYSNRLSSYSIFAYTVEIRNEEYINHENFMKYLEDKYELVSIKNKIESGEKVDISNE